MSRISKFIRKKNRKKKRGVVRTIDFLVSFTLFIILVTQFYLIIINLNLNLALSSKTKENPAELLADKLLSSKGTKNWGITPGDPLNFGLASETPKPGSNSYLDLSKLARLNGELNFLSISSTYSYIDPDTLASQLTNGKNNLEFRISTRPPINIVSSLSPDNTTLTVSTLSWGNQTLSNVNLVVYKIILTNQQNDLPPQTSQSNVNGLATFPLTLGPENYVIVVYGYSGDSWGISWHSIQNSGNQISSSGISTFILNKPDGMNNTILQYTNNTISNDNVSTSTAYYNNGANNLTFPTILNSSSISQNLTSIGTTSPLIQVNFFTSSGIDYYRVVTNPLVYDYVNYTSPSISTFENYQFPVYQTNDFSSVILEEIYVYSSIVMTGRGPLLFTIEAYEY